MSWIFQLQSTYVPWGMTPSTEEEVCMCCMLCVVTVIWDYLTSKIHRIRMVTIDMLIIYPVFFRFYSFLFYWKVWWLFCVLRASLAGVSYRSNKKEKFRHSMEETVPLLLFIVPGHFRNIPLCNSKNPSTI